MKASELEKFIYENIPVVKTNNLTVGKVHKYCPEICGELKDHTNHRSTVFGGTISTALTVASWAQVRLFMIEHKIEAASVIAKEKVLFLRPVDGDFYAKANPLSPNEIRKIKKDLKIRGRAKVDISSEIYVKGQDKVCAKFVGKFMIFYE